MKKLNIPKRTRFAKSKTSCLKRLGIILLSPFRNSEVRQYKIAMWFLMVFICSHDARADYWPPQPPYDPRPLMLEVKKKYNGENFSFAVIGEVKTGCDGNDLLHFVDRALTVDFTVTMGDMVGYPPKWENYRGLAECAGWYMRKHPTWPTIGDQEGKMESINSDFPRFYGLPNDSYSFDMGPARFVFLSYFGSPISKGNQNGKYPTKKTPVTNFDTNDIKTLEVTLKEASDRGMHVFVFSHAQYYSQGDGTKKYANNPPEEIVDLYRDNNVRIVFQADNPGYSKIKKDGVYYIRNSGAYGNQNPRFLGYVEVDGARIVYKAIDMTGVVFDREIIR